MSCGVIVLVQNYDIAIVTNKIAKGKMPSTFLTQAKILGRTARKAIYYKIIVPLSADVLLGVLAVPLR